MIDTSKDAVLAYLRGEAEPDQTFMLDQLFAAADEVRAATGVESDGKVPWPSALEAIATLWTRLIDQSYSAGRRCEHLDIAWPFVSVVIDPASLTAFCLPCAAVMTWPPVDREYLTRAYLRRVAFVAPCDCCRKKFKGWQDVWPVGLQFLNFTAPVRLCRKCHDTIVYDRFSVNVLGGEPE